MLKIYKYGYELFETPEEKILSRWKSAENMRYESSLFYREGITDALNDLGIKVKGINS